MNRQIERDIRICPCCNQETERSNMNFTRDCHGITFRLVCSSCWEKLMRKGFDVFLRPPFSLDIHAS